jgi:outer membrane lipoprotein LolB
LAGFICGHSFRYGVFFCLFLLLPGCATVPVSPELKSDWADLRKLESWTMKGRVAFRHGADGWHGRINWVSSPKQDKIKISGPIGQGAVVIIVKSGVVEFLYADGRREVVRDHEALLEKRLGLPVPLKALRWWMRGLPKKGEPFDLVKEDPSLIVFRQGDWLISQWDFRLSGATVFPHRLKFESEKLLLKFVIDGWEGGSVGGQ